MQHHADQAVSTEHSKKHILDYTFCHQPQSFVLVGNIAQQRVDPQVGQSGGPSIAATFPPRL